MNNDIKRLSPLTESSYYILISLIKPMHGYGIIKKVEEMSEGRVKLAAGTLYGAINTMLSNKIIKAMGEDATNPRRKLYQITDLGIDLIDYELKRLNEMVSNGFNEREKKL